MTEDKRKAGRPALPPGEKLVVVPVRLTLEQKAKLQRIGVQRLREWIDKAKERGPVPPTHRPSPRQGSPLGEQREGTPDDAYPSPK